MIYDTNLSFFGIMKNISIKKFVVCKSYIGGKLYGTNNGILHYILSGL